jgi:valyl-tRNA synthetase
MKSRFVDWVQNLQWDWCISRQRFSGIPFPVWYDKHTGKAYVAGIEHLPIDPREDVYPGVVPAGVELVPDTEVMDTWNTSSLTPYICKSLFTGTTEGLFDNQQGSFSFLPMAMRPQAHDIIRTWAFYTMVKSYLHNGCLPWKEIVISGHVLSRDGGKISKSKGNNPLEPETLLATYPADVIRYWTTAGTLGQDVAFSENTLKIGGKLLNKLWNAARFVQEHTQDVHPLRGVDGAITGEINQWILHRVNEVFAVYSQYFERNEYSLALSALETFFWNDYCDNYLEFIKPILFKPENYSSELVSNTRAVLAHITLRVLQLFAPCMPFVTDQIYQELFATFDLPVSIHLTKFVTVQKRFVFDQALVTMHHFGQVVDAVRKLKSEHAVSLKTPISSCVVVCSEQDQAHLEKLANILQPLLSLDALQYARTSTAGSQLIQVGDLWHATVVLQ